MKEDIQQTIKKINDIVRLLKKKNISRQFVHYTIGRLEDIGDIKDRKRTGRRLSVRTPGLRKRIYRIAKNESQRCLRKLSKSSRFLIVPFVVPSTKTSDSKHSKNVNVKDLAQLKRRNESIDAYFYFCNSKLPTSISSFLLMKSYLTKMRSGTLKTRLCTQ